jgi:hypothetical protein
MALGIAYLIVCALVYRRLANELWRGGRELTFEEVTTRATSTHFAALAGDGSRELLRAARGLYFTSFLCVALGALLIFAGQTLG